MNALTAKIWEASRFETLFPRFTPETRQANNDFRNLTFIASANTENLGTDVSGRRWLSGLNFIEKLIEDP
jgi:hypothetical protein